MRSLFGYQVWLRFSIMLLLLLLLNLNSTTIWFGSWINLLLSQSMGPSSSSAYVRNSLEIEGGGESQEFQYYIRYFWTSNDTRRPTTTNHHRFRLSFRSGTLFGFAKMNNKLRIICQFNKYFIVILFWFLYHVHVQTHAHTWRLWGSGPKVPTLIPMKLHFCALIITRRLCTQSWIHSRHRSIRIYIYMYAVGPSRSPNDVCCGIYFVNLPLLLATRNLFFANNL